MSFKPDMTHMENLIVAGITKICRNDNVDREKEMAEMIEFLCKMHITAITTLAGAVMVTAKMHAAAEGEDADDEAMGIRMRAVSELIKASDQSFTLQLRSKILAMAENWELPNPFTHESTHKDSQ